MALDPGTWAVIIVACIVLGVLILACLLAVAGVDDCFRLDRCCCGLLRPWWRLRAPVRNPPTVAEAAAKRAEPLRPLFGLTLPLPL